MNQSVFTATRGILAQQQRVDIIANNVANINTLGYKSVRADFKDALYQATVNPEPQNGSGTLQRGHGVMLGNTHRTMRQGNFIQTGNALDFAIMGEGFFTVQGADGEIRYTRDGNFTLSNEGGEGEEAKLMLVTASGEYVLDASGQKIELSSASGISVNEKGEIFLGKAVTGEEPGEGEAVDPDSLGEPVAKLGVVSFVNNQGLLAVGGNRLEKTEASGEPKPMEEPVVIQNGLEQSNVEMGEEFSRLIRAQRAMSLASRALTVADGMDGMVNQMR